MDFQSFEKIPRLRRDCVITEKIDGTNASVFVPEDGPLLVGSRSRWITVDDDNFGFARFVALHEAAFRALGTGHHFGEWWGSGIQRGYGLTNGDRRFSLFNTGRWTEGEVPEPLHVVPVIYTGLFSTLYVGDAIVRLRDHGSLTAPGFMKPEGLIVYHTAARSMFKQTLERDDEWKGKAA